MEYKPCVKVSRPPVGPEVLCKFSSLLLKDHVFWAVQEPLRSLVGCHYYFCDLEKGKSRLYMCLGENDEFLGCVTGEEIDGVFWGHLFFDLGVSALECMTLAEPVIIADYAHDGIVLKATEAAIPEYNQAAQRVAKRFGFVDMGILPGLTVRRGEELKEFQVRRFRKELKNNG